MNNGQKKLCKTVSKHFGMSAEAVEELMEKKAYDEHMRLWERTRPLRCPCCKVMYSQTFWKGCPIRDYPRHAFYRLILLDYKMLAKELESDRKFLEGVAWGKPSGINPAREDAKNRFSTKVGDRLKIRLPKRWRKP